MSIEELIARAKELKSGFIVFKNGKVDKFTSIKVTGGGFSYEDRASYGKHWASASSVLSLESSAFQLPHPMRYIGADPEFFFVDKDNEVVPAKCLLSSGLDGIVEDGFQVELHPDPSACRQLFANALNNQLGIAKDLAKRNGLKLSTKVAMRVGDKPWKMLSQDERRFGCSPTSNIHENTKRVTGVRERWRSCGGHIHLTLPNRLKSNPTKVVSVLDIVLGNTMVLLDRDDGNITRRKNYGRAGEYRSKSYGLEYRVLSNFWATRYVYLSMVFALARNALGLVESGLDKELLKRVDFKKVRKAINNNDKDLALETLQIVAEFFREKTIMSPKGLSAHNIDAVVEWLSSDNPAATAARLTGVPLNRPPSCPNSPRGFENFIEAFTQDKPEQPKRTENS